ncbi:isoprenylcysteine carboxylmethyltransferase family protein [Candidatus Mycobacterium wuenschmannii]|uniref:methanethiol S-methyltransferase n=1 Tax=Candidatus Mycobacterium wuenschmannii TaxID=3027808 RepID=A0ABY8W0W6_9MYCO|nr:methanethiol S-methyltransferase [Candidatus Mycobacterium wuenschmannii]WIM88617.1 isoprenylcysteine carboxylmethyltransferase family protein [Candidatus Mycobacterium wuenschmannii]
MTRADESSSRPAESAVGGVVVAAYGFAVYAVFLLVFLYLIGFVADARLTVGGVQLIPTTIDHGNGDGAVTVGAVLTDLAVLALFGVQHSVMARPAFKRRWTRVIPTSAERSTYVLATNVCLIVLIAAWRPITADVWHVIAQPWRTLLVAVSAAGWLTVLISTYLIDHFDLFGLRQVLARLTRRPAAEHEFATPFFYRLVRHPIYTGFIIAFWCTPAMTLGHLLFAAVMTGYILFAVRLEERDLIAFFGDRYRDYRRRVPMLIPGLGGRS